MTNTQAPVITQDQSLSPLQEKLLHTGPETLSDSELLAILLGDYPLAERILQQHNGLGGLHEMPIAPQVHNLKIAALVALSDRMKTRAKPDRTTIHNSTEAYELLQDMADLTQEHVRIVLLDMDRKIIATPTLYIGTINASVIRVAEIFRTVIGYNSAAFILAHNHPASSAQPSPEDITITREISVAARLFDIHFIDHLIISRHDWCSIRELGLAFTD